MTPERERELAREMGLDEVPPPRVATPQANRPIPNWFKPKFYKALQLVDQIETWAFERFIPEGCVIDRTMDARAYDRDYSLAILHRTDVPPPSNERIGRATGIKPEDNSCENHYRWLAVDIFQAYTEFAAKAMAVPLIYRAKGSRWNPLIVPYIGAICKFDPNRRDGLTLDETYPNLGLLIPAGTKVDPSHLVTPVVTGEGGRDWAPYDDGAGFAKARPGDPKKTP